MPLIAQITGAVAVTALIVGPWWASAPDSIPEETAAVSTAPGVPPAPVTQADPAPQQKAAPVPVPAARPAHLNLDVRHSFANVDLSVAVDGKPVFQTKLAGSGKRFRMFGKRPERGYTKTLDLTPGVHLVKVRVLSVEEKFDQTRVERFDLGSAAVASMRISADKSGLSLVAERPPAPPPVVAAAPSPVAVAPVVPAPVATPVLAAAPVPQGAVPPGAAPPAQEASTVINLLQSVRSMLIGIAGFVASTATAFMVQEWLRTRRGLIFADANQASQFVAGERRRRRRHGKARTPRDGDSIGPADQEPAP